MDTTFHTIDLAAWPRREEFECFTQSGCGFSMTAEVDISHLLAFVHERHLKLYPVLVAIMAKVLNRHEAFRYGRQGEHFETFGYYDVIHPLFFALSDANELKCLCAPYSPDLMTQLAALEQVRKAYRNAPGYRPQGTLPPNTVNISCVPWVQFSNVSFSLQYAAYYYPPIVTFGKFSTQGDKTAIPLSVYCNHAVNDGSHCSAVFSEFQADSLLL